MIGGVGGPKSSKIVGRHSWTFHEHIFHSICLYCHFYCQSLRAERKIVSEFREQNQITNNTEHMKNPDAVTTIDQETMNSHFKKSNFSDSKTILVDDSLETITHNFLKANLEYF